MNCLILRHKLFSLAFWLLPLLAFPQSVQSFSYTSPLCSNSGSQLPVTSPNWLGGGSFSSTPGLNINAINGMINTQGSAPGLFTVTYSGGACTCTVTSTLLIAQTPAAGVIGTGQCAGVEFPVTVTATPAGMTYSWSSSASVSQTLSVSSPNTNHTLWVTDMNGCSGNIVFSVVLNVPATPVIVGSPSVCSGTTLNLAASGMTSYTWSTGSNSAVISVSPVVTTVYTVSGNDILGCTGAKTHTVRVIPTPSFAVNSATMCSGESASLSVIGEQTVNVNYNWLPGSVKGPTFVVLTQASRVYTVTGIREGCSFSATALVTVLKTLVPAVSFGYPIPLCTNHTEVMPDKVPGFTMGGIFSSVGGNGYTGTIPIDPLTGQLNLNGVKAGTYRVNYTVPENTLAAVGCTAAATSSAIIAVLEPGQLKISADVRITEGESTTLSVSGGESYNWGPQIWLSCTDCAQPVASPKENTRYCVSAFANGCYSEACVNVEVICINENDFSVPNAFTPNRDGNNDRFCLQGWERCSREFNVKIFTRWGQMVFESDQPDFCWDGTSGGVLLDSDVFVYVIRAKFAAQDEIVKSGNITLIR